MIGHSVTTDLGQLTVRRVRGVRVGEDLVAMSNMHRNIQLLAYLVLVLGVDNTLAARVQNARELFQHGRQVRRKQRVHIRVERIRERVNQVAQARDHSELADDVAHNAVAPLEELPELRLHLWRHDVVRVEVVRLRLVLERVRLLRLVVLA